MPARPVPLAGGRVRPPLHLFSSHFGPLQGVKAVVTNGLLGGFSHRLAILIRSFAGFWEKEAGKSEGDLKVARLRLKPLLDFEALRGAEAPLFHGAGRIRA